MYCPKCGKKLPDGARFCDQCGANLTGIPQHSKTAERIGWIICLALSVLALFFTYSLLTFIGGFLYFRPPFSGIEIFILVIGFSGLIGLLFGVSGLYASYQNDTSVNPTPSKVSPTPKDNQTAVKMPIDGYTSAVKCSRCRTTQSVSRTSCKKCGAKFIESEWTVK